MNVDHTEFIAKHHKVAGQNAVPAHGKKRKGSLLFALVLLLCVAVGLFAVSAYYPEIEGRFYAGLAFVFVGFGVVLVWRSFSLQSHLDKELAVMTSVMEGSRAARLITDGADNAVYFNQKFERLCRGVGPPGYASLVRLFHNNNEAMTHFSALADKAHRGLTDSIELFSKLEDKERWLMVTVQPLAGFAGCIHWRIDDVTQKYTLDVAIREERQKLIDFTDNAPVGFFSVNEEGQFIFANATFARWVGEDLRYLLEHGKLHTYLEAPPENANPYDVSEDSKPRQVCEVMMKGAAGRTFLASINQAIVSDPGGAVRTRAVVYDLTAEREMRMALKESEARFQRFFEEAPLGIVLLNDDGTIADCNNAFAMMLGSTVKKIEAVSFHDILCNDNKDEILKSISDIEHGQKTSAPLEVSLNYQGRKLDAQMHARRFKEGGNAVLHFIDVTEQKQLEEQFVQSQKMQAIGQLAGGVAHDFNNLLTAILGFCDLLLLRHKPGDPSFADIMQIKQNSNRAANLVRQLLAFSRQQTLRPRVHDVADILNELSHLMRRLIGAGIELDLVYGDDLGLVKVDEGQMEQVLINLAVNARDAMKEAGSLTIMTENYTNRETQELISEELPPGHWVLIKVRDTGCGIPQENMKRIFEPFFTTKDVGEGTGLGLATVYGIIRQTGGYLDVQSVVDEGTSFHIYLPRVSELEEEEAEEEQKTQEEDENKDLTGTECILLIEDEDAVRTFSERALANKGYEVLSAECGQAALDLLDEIGDKKLDLVVSDVVMPDLDGPTVVSKIREKYPDLKIIFVSGYTEDKLKDSMDDNTWFLPKPFSLKKLAAKVKEVLEA